jgi:drug/metabolite transporter (DMT)-like permease
MLLLAIMWGLSIPVTKLGLVTMPPLTLTALRFAVAVPLLFFWVVGRQLLFVVGRQRPPWRAFPHIAALGVLGIGVGQVTQTLAWSAHRHLSAPSSPQPFRSSSLSSPRCA